MENDRDSRAPGKREPGNPHPNLTSEDGYCAKEIHRKKIFMDTHRQIKFGGEEANWSLVWSAALYAAQTWTVVLGNRSKLEAFEMWIWKRMQKISCVDKKINEEILNMVQEDVVEWQTATRLLGKRTRRRRRIQLIDNLLEKKNYTDLKNPLKAGVSGEHEETVINLLHKQISEVVVACIKDALKRCAVQFSTDLAQVHISQPQEIFIC